MIDPRRLKMVRRWKEWRESQRRLKARAPKRGEAEPVATDTPVPVTLSWSMAVVMGVWATFVGIAAVLVITGTSNDGALYWEQEGISWQFPLASAMMGAGLFGVGYWWILEKRRRDWLHGEVPVLVFVACVTVMTLLVFTGLSLLMEGEMELLRYLLLVGLLFFYIVGADWIGGVEEMQADDGLDHSPGVPAAALDGPGQAVSAHELAILRFAVTELERRLAGEPERAWVWLAKLRVGRFAASTLSRELAKDAAPVTLGEDEQRLIRESHPLLQEGHVTEEMSRLSMHHAWYEGHLKRLRKFLAQSQSVGQ